MEKFEEYTIKTDKAQKLLKQTKLEFEKRIANSQIKHES